MATEFESLAILLLQVLVLVCSLQVVLVMIVVYYLTRVQDLVRGATAVREQPVRTRPLPSPEPALPSPPPASRGESRPPAKPAYAVEILEDRRDIRGSVQAICDKFTLRDLIITTRDGLVVVSSTPGVAEEAARLTAIHRRGGKTAEKDLLFLPVVHRGEELLGILRADRTLDETERKAIEKDVAQILNWWL
ncbi:MAG: hypothetical protein LUQ62_02080 [Methanomicrobiales archaeon]|nr:hypothetical protein [Methanomicrobiales archaeon]